MFQMENAAKALCDRGTKMWPNPKLQSGCEETSETVIIFRQQRCLGIHCETHANMAANVRIFFKKAW